MLHGEVDQAELAHTRLVLGRVASPAKLREEDRILGFTDLLLEKTPHDSQEYEMLKSIERQGINAKRVVENLLSFARHKEHSI